MCFHIYATFFIMKILTIHENDFHIKKYSCPLKLF